MPQRLGRSRGRYEARIEVSRGGWVTAFDLDNVIVNYDIGNLRFDNQIEIEGVAGQAFSDGGDVGGSNGLGLTYANPIHRVLKDLKATLLF